MSKRGPNLDESPVKRLKRANVYEEQRNLKPGHCNKFLHVVIDPEFLQGLHGSEILSKLNELNLKYEIKQQQMSRVITFYRTTQQNLTQNGSMTPKTVEQKFVIYLLMGQDLVSYVKNRNLPEIVRQLELHYPGKTLFLLIYGLVDYCQRNRGSVGRTETEMALTEVQLLSGCSHQLIESPEAVGNFVARLGKSLAELPYKQQQLEKNHFGRLYVGNEKKGCVRVNGTIGLHQLYQNQLMKIPSVTLQVAEAIITAYPTISKLIDGFRMCGPNMLSDIAVRRAGGPITSSVRKIGPALSSKIYTLYNGLNPNQTVSARLD